MVILLTFATLHTVEIGSDGKLKEGVAIVAVLEGVTIAVLS